MKTVLFAIALAALLPLHAVPASANEPDVTAATCKADYDAMIAEAERNREHSLRELHEALAQSTSDDARDMLNAEIDQTWEDEEEYRNAAAHNYRDCIDFATFKPVEQAQAKSK